MYVVAFQRGPVLWVDLVVVSRCSNGCTTENLAEMNPELTQNILDASAGYLQVVSLGLADNVVDFDGLGVDQDSGFFAGAEWGGGLATLPFDFTRAGGIAIQVGTLENFGAECVDALDIQCAEAGVVAAAANFAPALRSLSGVAQGTAPTAGSWLTRNLSRQNGFWFNTTEILDTLLQIPVITTSTWGEANGAYEEFSAATPISNGGQGLGNYRPNGVR